MFRKITLFLVVFIFVSCGSTREISHKKQSSSEIPTLADKIIWSAFKYRGVKYKYGGTTKKGIDCSGLVMVSFAERGIYLPRNSYEMSKQGYSVSLKKARRGDLIFFKTNPKKPNKISHVGIITHVENGVIKFLHSSTKRGVTLNTMNNDYYKKTFTGVRRVLD